MAWPARAFLFICLAGFPWLPLLAYSAPSFADLPAYLPAAGTALIFRSYLPSSRRCGDDDGDDDYDGDYAIGFLLETQHPQSYNLCSEWWCDLTSPNKSLFVSFHLSCLQFCNYLNTMHYVLFWAWTFESIIKKISASFPGLMKFLSLELFSCFQFWEANYPPIWSRLLPRASGWLTVGWGSLIFEFYVCISTICPLLGVWKIRRGRQTLLLCLWPGPMGPSPPLQRWQGWPPLACVLLGAFAW